MNKQIRKFLIEKANERCQRCGRAERHEKTGRVPLEVEHIDGDWQNACESNLAVLCPNCHALTPTFRGMNRGKGRPGRPGLRPKAAKETLATPPRMRLDGPREFDLFNYRAISQP